MIKELRKWQNDWGNRMSDKTSEKIDWVIKGLRKSNVWQNIRENWLCGKMFEKNRSRDKMIEQIDRVTNGWKNPLSDKMFEKLIVWQNIWENRLRDKIFEKSIEQRKKIDWMSKYME